MTAPVPSASARGTLCPGSRTSSATYVAAFHPEYVNITGISASSQPAGATGAGALRCAIDPAPNENPMAMKETNAVTLRLASTSPTTRPGPTPRRCRPAIAAMTATAVSVCADSVRTIAPGTIGTTSHGTWLATPGAKRPR